MEITILGSGSPIPAPGRAGPSGLVRAGQAAVLVDAGRGVLLRLAEIGLHAPMLNSVLLTHLHSDHTTDFNDVVTTWWVAPMTDGRPLRVIGPPGTAAYVERTIEMLSTDIGFRIEHHADIETPPLVEVTEATDGTVFDEAGLRITAELVDHGVVKPAIGYRFESLDSNGQPLGPSAVWAGDTIPCSGLDRLCKGADIYVQTVIDSQKVLRTPIARLHEILDYHSDLEGAARTARQGGVETLVLNHPIPDPIPGTEQEWIEQAAKYFGGEIILATDLLRCTVGS